MSSFSWFERYISLHKIYIDVGISIWNDFYIITVRLNISMQDIAKTVSVWITTKLQPHSPIANSLNNPVLDCR